MGGSVFVNLPYTSQCKSIMFHICTYFFYLIILELSSYILDIHKKNQQKIYFQLALPNFIINVWVVFNRILHQMECLKSHIPRLQGNYLHHLFGSPLNYLDQKLSHLKFLLLQGVLVYQQFFPECSIQVNVVGIASIRSKGISMPHTMQCP